MDWQRTLMVVSLIGCMVSLGMGSSGADVKKVKFCDLVASAEAHDKLVVSTEAVLLPGYHSLALFDPVCRPTEAENTTTQAILWDGWNKTKLGKR